MFLNGGDKPKKDISFSVYDPFNSYKESSVTNKNVCVFLGGTANPPDYRDSIIPMLKINFFNPIVDDWNEEAQRNEEKMKKECSHSLFVITPQMTAPFSIAEAVDLSNKNPKKVIFTVLEEWDDMSFDKGQMRSMRAVGNMIEGNGGVVFYNFDEAVVYLNSLG
ncbi:MAG: nucleoside 2-deoxyribosyltransferase domain-containing protein [Herbinix sp.]|nr:nucleoside 2-deoxyribosyltransferase domain-containing protein [Herbinix sp.]